MNTTGAFHWTHLQIVHMRLDLHLLKSQIEKTAMNTMDTQKPLFRGTDSTLFPLVEVEKQYGALLKKAVTSQWPHCC